MLSKSVFTSIALAVVSSIISPVQAKPAYGANTLVVIDSNIDLSEYSTYFDDLLFRGYELSIKNAKDEGLSLFSFGEKSYDNVILFPTQSKLSEEFSAHKLADFFNDGGNILAISTAKNPNGHGNILGGENIRDFASELDIAISPRNSKLVDHFNYDKDLSPIDHDTLILDKKNFDWTYSANIIEEVTLPILYNGAGAYLGNSELLFPILSAPSTAYVYNPKDESDVLESPWIAGSQSYLIAGSQGLNNARFMWVGSVDLFSNSFVNHKSFETGNRKLVNDLTSWAFQERGVLRTVFTEDNLANTEKVAFEGYKINDDLTYKIGISQWNGQKWVPFQADDVQLEFIMLDPYYRVNLSVESINDSFTTYATTFKIPDQHGVFTLSVDYKRNGLSYINKKKLVTVRHNANDEWARSWEISNSWVYLTSAVTVVVAWIAFVFFYVYSGNSPPQGLKIKKTQ
ncbi:Dolichyl-diphosphooligosaccharide-protein glycosyltransferase 48kDa subunit [Nadsonia fulvescens var. elongata DSM 6958]|uniref:Dolichyl-diphosphooligosaccharide--protein glycosyltransferase subunit WBP1 n=1 Tax=Nadsonia fulvescens var. elongata DSM 6958 TaxID=857566 RepID=A0A1E3PT65_9ASCO|nr:Dolichyl-diphosphooligosaccharide-protein glycosyltransferase 48kDa subunit [Nadsonia fulvescens var. elongata DSM 6958]